MTSNALPLVVVLEDDPASADALARLLGDWGCECVHGDAFEAVADLVAPRADQVRAIISDYHLKGETNGIEAVAALMGLGVAAPAVILTGTLRGEARRAVSAAGLPFIEKPVAPKRLKAWLERVAQIGG